MTTQKLLLVQDLPLHHLCLFSLSPLSHLCTASCNQFDLKKGVSFLLSNSLFLSKLLLHRYTQDRRLPVAESANVFDSHISCLCFFLTHLINKHNKNLAGCVAC